MSQSDPEPDVSKMVLPGGTLSALLTHPVHKTLEAPQTPDIKKMEFVLEDKQPDSADVKILTPKTTHPMKAHATHIDTHINGEGHGHPGVDCSDLPHIHAHPLPLTTQLRRLASLDEDNLPQHKPNHDNLPPAHPLVSWTDPEDEN